MVLRFLRFNAVGALGIGVQVAALSLLAGAFHVHYLVATAIAIELSILHNFLWHTRWTWAPARGEATNHVLVRCLAFHAGNGLVSMLGTLALMPLFVGRLRLHFVIGNLLAIACTGLVNFFLGDRLIFPAGTPNAPMHYHWQMPRQPHLFTPLTLRGLELRNRILMSPMCQYSATDGIANDWHLVHLGSRAVGGVGLVIVEATGVEPEGRISPRDLGLWSDAHVAPLSRIVRFVTDQGAASGIQLAHAGRKASTSAPWDGGRAVGANDGGWTPVAPSAIPFADGFATPRALDREEIEGLVERFATAAVRARAAGFDVIELHAAHGYLLHEFLSPLTNHRDDEFGGSYENRVRFPLMVAGRLRETWPADLPVFVRISATDWVDGGWSLDDSVEFARRLKAIGIDLVDCSSGGLVMDAKIPAGPGYQTPLAATIRQDAGIATGAVGLVTSPEQAEQILATGQADAVLLARELLRNPYWPLVAARKLGASVEWPRQYLRARV